MIASSENVARLLKPVWVYDGRVSSAAFNLRPHIHETYISVLREAIDTFTDDARKVSKTEDICYASLNTGKLERLEVKDISDKVEFGVYETDNERLKSHAGIFVSVNGQRIVGGEPFEALELQKGKSADELLLDIRRTLAKLASRHIVQLNH